jgi:transcriptional regulator with XRE-family HTH domain
MEDEKYQKQLHFILSRMKEERLKANMSQIELSFAAGLSQNQVNSIETGRNIPNLYTFLKICDALNISPENLFSQTDKEREEARNQIIALAKKYI